MTYSSWNTTHTHRLTLFMTFCCCVWFCLSETTSLHSTSFCLQTGGGRRIRQRWWREKKRNRKTISSIDQYFITISSIHLVKNLKPINPNIACFTGSLLNSIKPFFLFPSDKTDCTHSDTHTNNQFNTLQIFLLLLLLLFWP